MTRVEFKMHDFPKFVHWAQDTDNGTWTQDFVDAGFETMVYEAVGQVSLGEEEYTLFVLRWS